MLTTTAALFLYLAGSRSPLLLLLHCVEDGIGCGISRLDASPSPLLTFTLYQHCYRYSVLAPSAYAFPIFPLQRALLLSFASSRPSLRTARC